MMPDHQSGVDFIKQIIDTNPTQPKYYYYLGEALTDSNQLDQAVEAYRRAITLDPNYAEAYYNLGVILHKQGRLEEAVQAYQQTLELSPKYADAYHNLGALRYQQDRLEEAVQAYRELILIDEGNLDAYYDLATIFRQQGRVEDLIDCYEKILQIKPTNISIAHMISVLKGEAGDEVPLAYIEKLFDGYAESYDLHMVESLECQIPLLLRQKLDKITGQLWFNNVVDLGCGTGLSGQTFRDVSTRLTGVDISSKMIEMAKEKNIYDYLEVNDLMTFFGSNREKFDLFISADVFGYIGELDSIFKGVSETAAARALFLFSVENYDQEEASSSNLSYVVRPSGRVAHSKRYITDLIDQYQFSLEHCEEATIRKDYDRSVSGDLYRLRKL